MLTWITLSNKIDDWANFVYAWSYGCLYALNLTNKKDNIWLIKKQKVIARKMRLIFVLLSLAWADVRDRDVSNGLQMKNGLSDSVHFKFKLGRSDKPSLVRLILYHRRRQVKCRHWWQDQNLFHYESRLMVGQSVYSVGQRHQESGSLIISNADSFYWSPLHEFFPVKFLEVQDLNYVHKTVNWNEIS